MPSACQQSTAQPESSDAYLPVDEAAPLLGLRLRATRYRCEQWAKRGLAHKAPPRCGGAKPCWWIARSVDPRLARAPSRQAREDLARQSLMERHPAHLVDLAYVKAQWLKAWRKAVTGPRPAGATTAAITADVVAAAKHCEGDAFKISRRSLQLWYKQYNTLGPPPSSSAVSQSSTFTLQPSTASNASPSILGVSALVPKYALAPQHGGGDGTGGDNPGPPRSPEAIENFYALYHTENQISIKRCHDMTLRAARKHGWSWPAGYSATCRWLTATDDRALTLLMRHGSGAYSHRYMQHLEIEYLLIAPGELYVCDHTQCDFWVSYKNQQIRPWLTAILDCRSRVIVGWRLGPSPHQEAILEALLMAFRDWAIPDNMRIDNGKDFCSKTITGLTKPERDRVRRQLGGDYYKALTRERDLVDCVDTRFLGVTGELGVDLIYAIPYAAWSKGQIERWFGTFHGQCGKTFATYCGNSTITRPECIEQIRSGYTKADKKALRKRYGRDWKKVAALKLVDQSDVPTLEDARSRVGKYIELYHRTAHSAPDMLGATPLSCWSTATRLRKAGDDELMLLMAVRGIYRVGANGVRVKAGSMPISYGARHPAISRLKGRDVLITADPTSDRVDHVYAFTVGDDKKPRRFIARLEANERVSPLATTDAAREAIAEQLRTRKNMRQAAASAADRTRTATQLLNRDIDERLAEARATGTDPKPALASVVPVTTGFESVSIPDQTQIDPAPDPYAGVDLLGLALQGDDDEDRHECSTRDEYAGVDLLSLALQGDDDDDDSRECSTAAPGCGDANPDGPHEPITDDSDQDEYAGVDLLSLALQGDDDDQ